MKVVCMYNKLRENYNLTINKTYDVIETKIYGAFPTYVIKDDIGDIKECSSILFLELERVREIKLGKIL